ncbi:MAG: 3-oxoacyl-[acyl-carrier-protein] reductase [Bacillota bacterium]
MIRLEKCAVVTGASRGIGREIAIQLAKAGYDVVVNFASSETAAKEVVAEIETLGVKAISVKADTGIWADAEMLIKTANETFGGVHVLVNNAGITKDGLIARMKEEDFDQVIQTNLKGTFNCIKHATSIMMKQREGRIINMTSVVALFGNAGQTNYVASKAGVIGLTKSVARELAPRGITCNAIAPGFIDTDMTKDLPESVCAAMLSQIPLKRFGSPNDVANLVVFLASEQASYITGQTINVDGGMAMY